MMALIHKSYKMSMKAWAKLTGRNSWRATAFESIRASQISEEEVVVAGAPVVIMEAEVAAMLVESQAEVAERREKSNNLIRYSYHEVSSY